MLNNNNNTIASQVSTHECLCNPRFWPAWDTTFIHLYGDCCITLEMTIIVLHGRETEMWMKILGKMNAYVSLLLVDGTDRNRPCHYELVGTPWSK